MVQRYALLQKTAPFFDFFRNIAQNNGRKLKRLHPLLVIFSVWKSGMSDFDEILFSQSLADDTCSDNQSRNYKEHPNMCAT